MRDLAGVEHNTSKGWVGQLRRRNGRRLFTVGVGAALVVGALTSCQPVLSLHVDTAADGVDQSLGDGICATPTGTCSLRAAISEANATAGFDRITIASGVDPVLSIAGDNDDTNASGDLDITSDIEIRGEGATVDGAGLDRVLHVVAGNLTVHDMTITGGSISPAERGGGLRSDAVLKLHGSTVTDNAGGGVFSDGTQLVVTNSTVSGNGAGDVDGAVMVVSGSATVTASLIDDSRAGLHASATADVTILDSTVVGDLDALVFAPNSKGSIVRTTIQTRASTTGGYGVEVQAGATVGVAGSVIDAPWAVGNHALCNGDFVSWGYNVASDDSCNLEAPTDVIAATLLGPLADNGGPSLSMLAHVGSPVIDRIPASSPFCTALPFDQRGQARPSGSACDGGAVEGVGPALTPLSLVVDTASDGVDVNPGNGSCETAGGTCSLRAAVMETNVSDPYLADVITIAAGVEPVLTIAGSGEDLSETGDLDVTGELEIHGHGATIDGSGLDRVIDHSAKTLTLEDLTITGGIAPGTGSSTNSTGTGNGGGLRSTHGEVVATGVTLKNNQAGGSGGGLAAIALTGTGLVVTDNSAAYDGGGLYSHTAELTDSNIATNHATNLGGGGAFGGVTISRSLINANTAGTGGGLASIRHLGGAGTLRVATSTISANAANQFSAIDGGALFHPGLELTASTVSGNTGDEAIKATEYFCYIGCGWVVTTVVTGSILVGAPGFAACVGPLSSASSMNLAPDATCGTSLAGTGALGPLADNGGVTFTHLPLAGSGAVDAVPAATAGLCDGTVPVDQRGMARPTGPACDVGAVEQ